MPTFSYYVALGTAVYVLMGIICYIIDRRIGKGIYRWWYNWTHKIPLPVDADIGFIHKQYTKNQVAVAAVLSVTFSVIAVFTMEVSWLVEFLVAFVECIAMMIGFKLGPWAYKLYEGKDKALDVIDKLERGEINLTDEIKEAASDVTSKVTEGAKELVDVVVEGVKETVHINKDEYPGESEIKDDIKEAGKQGKPEKEIPSFEEALKKYSKGDRDGEQR